MSCRALEAQPPSLAAGQALREPEDPALTTHPPCRHPLRWYIMTSPATDAETRSHFADHAFFGLRPAQVVFFVQGALPALTEEGRVIMASPAALALSPDGNGGVYTALRREGVLADMAAHGVEALDCFSVDNALVRPADPVFAGFCLERGTQCGEL